MATPGDVTPRKVPVGWNPVIDSPIHGPTLRMKPSFTDIDLSSRSRKSDSFSEISQSSQSGNLPNVTNSEIDDTSDNDEVNAENAFNPPPLPFVNLQSPTVNSPISQSLRFHQPTNPEQPDAKQQNPEPQQIKSHTAYWLSEFGMLAHEQTTEEVKVLPVETKIDIPNHDENISEKPSPDCLTRCLARLCKLC